MVWLWITVAHLLLIWSSYLLADPKIFLTSILPGEGQVKPSNLKIQLLTNLMINLLGCPTRPAKKSRVDSDVCSSSCCEDCECDCYCCTTSEENDIENTISSLVNVSNAFHKPKPDDAQTNQTVTTIMSDLENCIENETNAKTSRPTGLFRQLSVLMRNTKKKLK